MGEHTELTNSYHKHRGNRRKQDWGKANRKAELSKHWNWNEPILGRLRKGKIHCSCFMCRGKTNHRKMKRGSDRYGNTWSVSDMRKIDSMRDRMVDAGSAIGDTWEDVQDEIFTTEEIAESKFRTTLMNDRILYDCKEGE